MVDVIHIEIFGLASAEEIISAGGVGYGFYVFCACVVVGRYLAEVAPSACHLRVEDALQTATLGLPDEDFSLHC